jgi:phosphoglucosamine mutase
MIQNIFGTDGVRGRANAWPITPDLALRLAQVVGRRFRSGSGHARVVIGKDTRLSGYMLESAMQAGFTSAGMDVMLLGPVPTPAVGMLTRSLRADVGVMISASHNPYEDNGIKLFGPDGYKISDEEEAVLTAMLDARPELAPADQIGRAKRIDGGQERYVEFAKATFPRNRRLDGLRVVVDAANGAAYRTAPTALWELGADVTAIGVEPNGRNINNKCGSTHPEACRKAVIDSSADIGIALDGDADRVHLIDEKGMLVDGDQLMALIASRWADEGRLTGGALVATVMSNLGLERYLQTRGLRLERTKVGDRHVIERMRTGAFNVGGEQSGHIVLSDLTTTGDGLIAALQALAAMVETGRRASEVLHLFEPSPQVLRSVRNSMGAAALQTAAARKAIAAAEAALGGAGRLLVRPSGTEPVIRVMAEGDDAHLVGQVVAEVAAALTQD